MTITEELECWVGTAFASIEVQTKSGRYHSNCEVQSIDKNTVYFRRHNSDKSTNIVVIEISSIETLILPDDTED